jgi:hypothetical protein
MVVQAEDHLVLLQGLLPVEMVALAQQDVVVAVAVAVLQVA